MNREIKFRAWDRKNKLMVTEKNVYELIRSYGDQTKIKLKDNFLYIGDEWYPCYYILGIFDYFHYISSNEDLEVMQYTGLKDNNGKEIYEGDILAVWENGYEDNKDNYEVKYFAEASGYPAFDLSPHWDSESNGLSEVTESGEFLCEVIGNLYENPELLTR